MTWRFENTFTGPDSAREVRGWLASALTRAGFPAVDAAILAGNEYATNALKHSASGLEGGKYLVRCEIAPDRFAQVEVDDQGPIGPDVTPSPEQVQARAIGFGLGLRLVKELVSEAGAFDREDGHHVAWFRITWPTSTDGGTRP
jgi:anti-sigma regulatory factor (Ser/Thr protein kinase)